MEGVAAGSASTCSITVSSANGETANRRRPRGTPPMSILKATPHEDSPIGRRRAPVGTFRRRARPVGGTERVRSKIARQLP